MNSQTPPSKLRVFIVDDDPVITEVAASILRQTETYEYEVETCTDSTEAYRKIRNGNYHLIISDINMPEVTGDVLSFCVSAKSPKTSKSWIRPRIILMSGMTDHKELAMKSHLSGADAWVAKPLSIDSFLETVNRVLADHL